MNNTVREVALILLAALGLICVTAREVRKDSEAQHNPDAARVRTLEAKVSRLKDELEFREFQTSSTILKGE